MEQEQDSFYNSLPLSERLHLAALMRDGAQSTYRNPSVSEPETFLARVIAQVSPFEYAVERFGSTLQARVLPGIPSMPIVGAYVTVKPYPYAGFNLIVSVRCDNKLLSLIKTGIVPEWIAVNKYTNRVYVSHDGSSDLYVIDGDANGVIDRILFDQTEPASHYGKNSEGVEVDEVNNLIYVCNPTFDNRGKVIIIDGNTNQITAAIDVGAAGTFPFSIAINPNTNRAYVAVTNGICIINTSTNTVIATRTKTTSGVLSSGCVAINTVTNILYMASYSNNRVYVMDASTDTLTTIATITSIITPNDIAVNEKTNKAYTVSCGPTSTGYLAIIDDTYAVTTVDVDTTHGSADRDAGVAVNDVLNRIYVSGRSSAVITEVDGRDNSIIQVISITTSLYPSGIALIDGLAVNTITGRLYAALETEGSIGVIGKPC